ncbi:MAG: YhcH/YjgK/YiaL family protein [Oscillospiraceae bacterium]
MIFDTFDHYTVYLGLNPALDAALQTLAQQLQQPFALEKEQLAGGGWFFGTQYGTRARTELKAEAHQKYIDVMAARRRRGNNLLEARQRTADRSCAV